MQPAAGDTGCADLEELFMQVGEGGVNDDQKSRARWVAITSDLVRQTQEERQRQMAIESFLARLLFLFAKRWEREDEISEFLRALPLEGDPSFAAFDNVLHRIGFLYRSSLPIDH